MWCHGSAAARGDAGVLLLGPPGTGKSRLLLRLLDRGFILVADDQVELDGVIARPAPSLRGLVEARGLGLLRVPFLPEAHLVLCVVCAPPREVPRLPAPQTHDSGLPLLRLDAHEPAAPLLIEHAMDVLAGRTQMTVGAFAA